MYTFYIFRSLKNTIKNMMMYYFELLDDHYNDLGATIPDGGSKSKAIRYAKEWMEGHSIKYAQLSINSMTTSNLLDIIDIELNSPKK